MSNRKQSSSNQPTKRLRQSSLLDTFNDVKKSKSDIENNTADSGITMNASVESPGPSSHNIEPEAIIDISDTEETEPFDDNPGIPNKTLQINKLPINRSFECWKPLPSMRSDSSHTVVFNCNLAVDRVPKPYPKTYYDAWDSDHVRMPCSKFNTYEVKDEATQRDRVQSRWEIIERNLLKPMESCLDLQEAILSYNSKYENRWNFQLLNLFFTDVLEPEETQYFFSNLLNDIVSLALQLPTCCTHPIPLLKRGRNCSITISQQQVSCLLANALFCTFPRRNNKGRNTEYSAYPDINFNSLFAIGSKVKSEKLKCLFNYFKRVIQKPPTGVITIQRKYMQTFPLWTRSTLNLTKMYLTTEGFIEKDGRGLLQVDFANKVVGGGVLGNGCVQEEIRFLICPELLVTRLLTETLGESEVLLVTGCEQFNNYSGYSNSFAWEGDYEDDTPRDSWQRKFTQVVAMDATCFQDRSKQFTPGSIGRELNKAYCAFSEEGSCPTTISAVATGNWGCGAFRGDPRLKALIQLMAASQARRDLVYFTFGDETLKNDVIGVYEFLVQKEVTVGTMWKLLQSYHDNVVSVSQRQDLFDFIFERIDEVIKC